MGFVRFAEIDGKRVDVTNVRIRVERTCDRCGRYMETWTSVAVDHNILVSADYDVPVDLCAACVGDHFPGLADLASKVLSRV